jgi:hypothetical protein
MASFHRRADRLAEASLRPHSEGVDAVATVGLLSVTVAALGILATALFRLDGKIDAGFGRLDEKIEGLDGKMESGLSRLEARMDAGFDRVDAKFGRVEERLSGLERQLAHHLDRH